MTSWHLRKKCLFILNPPDMGDNRRRIQGPTVRQRGIIYNYMNFCIYLYIIAYFYPEIHPVNGGYSPCSSRQLYVIICDYI